MFSFLKNILYNRAFFLVIRRLFIASEKINPLKQKHLHAFTHLQAIDIQDNHVKPSFIPTDRIQRNIL